MSAEKCYDGAGRIADTNLPCNPNSASSACCGVDSICINNLYCVTPWGASVPGTCTDQKWGQSGYFNPACPCPPRYIGDQDLRYLDGVTFCTPDSFVCGANNSAACGNAELVGAVISYGKNNSIPNISSTALIASYYSGAHVSTGSISISSSTVPQSTTTVLSTFLPTSSPPIKTDSGMSRSTQVAIGVGVGLGVLAIAVLGFFGWSCYRRGKRNSAHQQQIAHEKPSHPIKIDQQKSMRNQVRG